MHTSLAAEGSEAVSPAQLAALVGRQIVRCTPLPGGRNNRVYRVVCDDGRVYAVKQYYASAADTRDRLGTEVAALQLLWQHGIRCVPRPLAMDRASGLAVYTYVAGRPIPPHAVTPGDIDAAVAFLWRLRELYRRLPSPAWAPASEACFSGAAVVANLTGRLARLLAVPSADPATVALQAFLQDSFLPAFYALTARATAGAGEAFTDELPLPARTLSPSDFGFHNARRTRANRLVFLDFEYFGVDDPAKLICDFLLHPAMALAAESKRAFLSKALAAFADLPGLATRVRYLYPLFGLKWCLILLNEFVPAERARRRFAQGAACLGEAYRRQQLAKAERLLRSLVHAEPLTLLDR
ncbi:MAG: aminoglycoside phosphotransferase [Candidatus Tectimicrobiota bacterium]|nr:MAG: aminoglycoside phosphotransferase [Candidatus Tectomicrobia bacterium]